jgi:hypothetical protein
MHIDARKLENGSLLEGDICIISGRNMRHFLGDIQNTPIYLIVSSLLA